MVTASFLTSAVIVSAVQNEQCTYNVYSCSTVLYFVNAHHASSYVGVFIWSAQSAIISWSFALIDITLYSVSISMTFLLERVHLVTLSERTFRMQWCSDAIENVLLEGNLKECGKQLGGLNDFHTTTCQTEVKPWSWAIHMLLYFLSQRFILLNHTIT